MGVCPAPGGGGCRESRLLPLNLTQISPLRTLQVTHPRIIQRMGTGSKIMASQVGGHAGVSTSEDGSLLIKPALPCEVSFYGHLNSNPVFAALKAYVPKFYGTLRFEGKVEDGNLETLREAPAPKEGKDKYFNLECR